MRASPAVRCALLAATIVSLAASFGLHPEPVGAEAVATHRGLASAHVDDPAHACPACLTPGAAIASRPLGLPRREPLAGANALRPEPAGPDRGAGRELPGRSPPASS